MNLLERAVAPTPRFFRVLRTIGLLLTTLAASVLGIESLPEAVGTVAAHVATAGAILTAVSQVTVDEKAAAAIAKAKQKLRHAK